MLNSHSVNSSSSLLESGLPLVVALWWHRQGEMARGRPLFGTGAQRLPWWGTSKSRLQWQETQRTENSWMIHSSWMEHSCHLFLIQLQNSQSKSLVFDHQVHSYFKKRKKLSSTLRLLQASCSNSIYKEARFDKKEEGKMKWLVTLDISVKVKDERHWSLREEDFAKRLLAMCLLVGFAVA